MSDKEYSEEFDRLRKNRVSVSFFKYGSARDCIRENVGRAEISRIKAKSRVE